MTKSAGLGLIVFGFGLGKRAGRRALDLLKRPALRQVFCIRPMSAV